MVGVEEGLRSSGEEGCLKDNDATLCLMAVCCHGPVFDLSPRHPRSFFSDLPSFVLDFEVGPLRGA